MVAVAGEPEGVAVVGEEGSGKNFAIVAAAEVGAIGIECERQRDGGGEMCEARD